MKLLLVATLLTAHLGHARSINPERIVTPFIDIFSTRNLKISEEKMEVRVSTYSKRGNISRGKEKLELPMARYQEILKESLPVLQMVTSRAKVDRGENDNKGTAFHIGENLVLTNHHVLSPTHVNFTDCDGFEVVQNQTNIVFSCKQVHYCNVKYDVCLIEMEPYEKSRSVTIELKNGPAVKLSSKIYPHLTLDPEMILTAIGNTSGLGLHYSQGRGFSVVHERYYFYAPLRPGNSGGPLLLNNLAIGVVSNESDIKVGNDANTAYNVAQPMHRVISVINEHVTDEEVLKKFNSAIAE